MFSLIALQDALIERFNEIEWNGVGEHKRRSRGRAMNKAIQQLVDQGYDKRSAEKIVEDAYDVWRLQQVCDAA